MDPDFKLLCIFLAFVMFVMTASLTILGVMGKA